MIKTLSAVLLLLTCASDALAKRLYKYQDEDGIWHYTDRKPDTDQPVEERLMEVDPERLVSMRRERKPDNTTHYYFRNHRHGPIEIEVRLGKAKNIKTNPPLPHRFVMHELGEQPLLTIEPADRRRSSSYQIYYSAVPGDPKANPESSYAYEVPFAAGERYLISQAFFGEATHNSPQVLHAVDIVLPEGTPVLAARGGLVMHVEEDFFGSGQKNRYADRANNVRVLHADGTMAVYAHLQHESVAVRPGQAVAAGEPLAKSGNTGYSTGPHLHFAVQRNAGMQLVTIPFGFSDGAGGKITPQASHWLALDNNRRATLQALRR